MVNDWVYFRAVHTLDAFLWGGELLGDENLPEQGPAVFVANHLGPLGPIGCVSSIPLRMYFWSVGDMLDKELAPDYLRQDFVEPQLRLKMPFSLKFSRALSKITVPLLCSLGCIPVYRGDFERMNETLKISLDLLLQGKCLLVFPENANMGDDTSLTIRPFQKTVFRLGEMYYEQRRKRLEFYPVAVHPTRKVKIGKPYLFNPMNVLAHERLRLKNLAETCVRRMYAEMENGDLTGLLTPAQK
jgi:hypothetical protein